MKTIACLLATAFLPLLSSCSDKPDPNPPMNTSAKDFFENDKRTVLTFLGYSGLGYEDEAALFSHATAILDGLDPKETLINIGVTPDGIGALYKLAKDKGFTTTGIVSSKAREYGGSEFVDHAFYIEDDTWGGVDAGTGKLSPTSEAMVEHSDIMVAIGGGEIARDELRAASERGKKVRFIPADCNHAKAIEKAGKNGKPAPTDFSGEAATAL